MCRIMKHLTYLILYGSISCCRGAKILGIFPVCVYSHFILGEKLMKELAKRGHEITVITPFPTKRPSENYKEVLLDEGGDYCLEPPDLFTLDLHGFAGIPFISRLGLHITEYTFNNSNVKRLLNSNATFDLVICQQFVNYAHMAFAHHFNASLILFSSQPPNDWTKNLLRHPLPSVYTPSYFTKYSVDMNTLQRMHNMALYLLHDIYEYFVTIPRHDDCLKKYLPDSTTISELSRSIDLVLYNSHVSTTVAVPTLPNMVEIGGIHIEEPKPLPGSIQKFLDEAVDGAIYFSMGSVAKSRNLPMEKRMAFLGAFSQLKQRVLWKWEDDTIEGLSENVRIGKWLPQQDVLAHPNVKLFITHCGLSSMLEAVHFGVPILGIPIFADQQRNGALAKTRGMAQTLRYEDITKDTLTETLNELLNNSKYLNNAKFRARIMRDQDMKPMDRALFWIEHVLRHRGAKHLQVHGIHMPWHQYYMVDLLVIALSFIVILILICYFAAGKCKKYYFVCCKEKVKNH